MISNSKTIKKKIFKFLKLFSRDLITEFVTQTQFRWHKPNINISEPTTTTKKKKKAFVLESWNLQRQQRKNQIPWMREREWHTWLSGGPPPNAWFCLSDTCNEIIKVKKNKKLVSTKPIFICPIFCTTSNQYN